jgi:hypothetical protein
MLLAVTNRMTTVVVLFYETDSWSSQLKMHVVLCTTQRRKIGPTLFCNLKGGASDNGVRKPVLVSSRVHGLLFVDGQLPGSIPFSACALLKTRGLALAPLTVFCWDCELSAFPEMNGETWVLRSTDICLPLVILKSWKAVRASNPI